MGNVYWITGLSGAGKTTVSKALYNKLKSKKDNVVFLDGDILRDVFGNDLGYTKEDRLKSAMRNSRLCKMLSEQGIDVICATISMFDDVRKYNRDNILGYKEIYLSVSLEVLKERNQKKLYSDGSNVVGMDIEFEAPKCPDIVIENDGSISIEEITNKLLNI